MNIDIIGAGIGGLTLANALKIKDITTTVYEQAERFKPVGAGIVLATNAMQVYKKLGLKEEIEENGCILSSLKITDHCLKPISNVNLGYFREKFNVKTVSIHRAILHNILVNRLGGSNVKLNHKLSEISQSDGIYTLHFNNNKKVIARTLVGADGINSKVRKELFPKQKIRKAGQVCWRGIVNYKLPQRYKDALHEAWGYGNRFGFTEIKPNVIYWYAVQTSENLKSVEHKELMLNYFGKYHSIINDIIRCTEEKDIHLAEMSDLTPNKLWHQNNVCLIGDAAHATTPNMGQGACQAIEDAYVLAECLEKYKLNKAFIEFQNARIKKVHRVVNDSWRIGKLAHWKNPVAVSLRNTILKMTPATINQKRTETLFQLNYN